MDNGHKNKVDRSVDQIILGPFRPNSDLKGDAMDRLIQMEEDAKTYLEQAAIKLNLTARGFHRVIRVARTIADLEQSENVARHHVGEAISFRNSAHAA